MLGFYCISILYYIFQLHLEGAKLTRKEKVCRILTLMNGILITVALVFRVCPKVVFSEIANDIAELRTVGVPDCMNRW